MNNKILSSKWDKTLFDDANSIKLPLISDFYNFKIMDNPKYSEIEINRQVKRIYQIKTGETSENNWKPFHQTFLLAMNLYPFFKSEKFEELCTLLGKIFRAATMIDDQLVESGDMNMALLDNSFDRYADHSNNTFGKKLWKYTDGLYEICDKKSVDSYLKKMFVFMEMSIRLTSKIDKIFNITSDTTIDDYLIWRNKDSGAPCIIEFLFLDDFNLKSNIIEITTSSDKYKHGLFKKLNQITENLNSLINDYYSFNKEIDRDDLLNCVKIYSYRMGSINQSINFIQNLILQQLKEFEDIVMEIKSQFPNNNYISQYCDRYQFLVGGIHKSHVMLPRYNIANNF